MKQIKTNNSRGMTLTELLAVLMIVSLLATIAVPVYVSRQEDARVRVALTECRQIADAEEAVAAMHGFYVPFQLLDDLPADPEDASLDEERIDRYPATLQDPYLIIPTVRAEDQFPSNLQLQLSQGYTGAAKPNPLVRKLVDNWGGPFINFQRFWLDGDGSSYEGFTDPQYRNSNDMFRDFPLDPWGNPYRFYSPIGLIGTDDNENDAFDFDDPRSGFSSGELTRVDQNRFQRYAVVSFGRDGIRDTDSSLPTNFIYNDIFHEFGTDGVSRNFGKF